ncbi:TPA: helix-turn-helix transcriptional regulator, partial [Escherichia coli]|nr:helix-turn-helix transcriptional regulator [Escherichia coli]
NISRRNSISFIFDMAEICSSDIDVSPLFWRSVSSFKYGVEINRIISSFYNYYSGEFCEKNVDALLSLLRLEIESLRMPKNTPVTCHDRSSFVFDFIRANLKNPNLRLSDLAEFLGVTERMVQYTLSQEKTSFHKLLSAERCRFLASKIKRNPKECLDVAFFESGFSSASSAIRQFKNMFHITPKQYQRKMLVVS